MGVVSLALVGGVTQVAHAAIPTGPTTTGLTGSRPSATTLPFAVSDQVGVAVDVATGNLEVTTAGLSLPGVTGTNAITGTYNSLGWQSATTTGALANRWSTGIAGAGVFASGASGAVVYTDADGATWTFTPASTAGTFTAPAGFNRVLKSSGTSTPTYTLSDPATGQVITSDVDGMPVSVKDRNSNTVAITNTSDVPTSVVSTAGTTAARTATAAYSSSTRTYTVTQGSGSAARSVKWVSDANGNLTSYVDGAGKTTTFSYSGTDLTQVTGPTGATTTVSYSGTTHKVSQVVQSNSTSGAAGASTTRLSYTSTTSTLVASPNTDPGTSVASVPHTTYTIDASKKLVTGATDAAGRVRSKTYNGANLQPSTSTTGSGSSASTTTATYGANSSQSLTKVASSGGASQSIGYNASPAATAYSPASTTDDAGNASSLTYDGVGNQLTSSSGSGATAATSTLTYTAGQVATATAPGNGTNKTTYAYTNKQLTGVTPVTITPTSGSAALGARAYSYDTFGRISSASDGAGRTTSYTYDGDDRVLTTSFSDSTPTVTNTYDAAGHLLTQVSGSGTVTNTYDELGNLLTTGNTANPSGISTSTYGYDKAGNQTSYTDQDGTVTSAYDDSGVLTSTTTPAPDKPSQTTNFITDGNGRRTDTYVDSNTDNSSWASHTRTDYDTSGRIQEIQGWLGQSRYYDLYYCYNAGSTSPNCGTTPTNDRSKIQWVTDNVSGQSTAYTYDTRGRITKSVTTGTGAATPGTWDFGYDIRGNRTSAKFTKGNGDVTTNQTLTYNAANQITTAGYAYDGAGNLTAAPTATFTYNGAEQMTKAVQNGSTVTNYTYAGADQKSLLSLSTPGGDTRTYQYGRADQNGNPTLTSVTRNGNRANIVNDAKTGQPIALSSPSGVLGQYQYDGSGNIWGTLVDNPAAFDKSYDPYGTDTIAYDGGGDGLPSNPFGFKAGTEDTHTGLVKFGLRWYNPYLGSWTQQDTLDSPLDPSNGNRYAYAAGDPINGSDPTGQIGKAAACSGLGWIEAIYSFVGGVGAVAAVVAPPPVDAFGAGLAAGSALSVGSAVLGKKIISC
ncbi:RHS repeat domain-containing protein [Curtobacterium sp. ME26]|uniref:RHS repeat domain-containing protein n=1 Tax=Curtobacterium sp. ME26 TaxID=2744254 RepID=UPI0015F5CF01|nr:RHS repeat-associated core domain-containing protein [Curtobacterium sp. ME26]